MNMILSEISVGGGTGLVHSLLVLLIIALCVGIVYAMAWYFFSKPPAPQIIMKIVNAVFVLIGGIIAINFLLSLFDKQFIRW
jgi:hypothetical protein